MERSGIDYEARKVVEMWVRDQICGHIFANDMKSVSTGAFVRKREASERTSGEGRDVWFDNRGYLF